MCLMTFLVCTTSFRQAGRDTFHHLFKPILPFSGCLSSWAHKGKTLKAGLAAASACDWPFVPFVLAEPLVHHTHACLQKAQDPPAFCLSPERQCLQAGVAVAFGSDWPVMPAEPLATMHTAANSDNLTLPSGALWGPGASVSPEEALHGHTVGGAVACNLESEVGVLRCVPTHTLSPSQIRAVHIQGCCLLGGMPLTNKSGLGART